MRRGALFVYLAGLCLVIAIFVAVFLILENEKVTIVKTSETKTIESHDLPEGMSVVEESGKRILRDERAGYQLNIEDKKIVNNEGQSIFLYSNINSLIPDLNLLVMDNQDNLNAEEWIEDFHKKYGLLYFDSKEKIKTNSGIEGFKVKEEGEIEHYSYHMILGNKVLIIDTPFDKKYENLIMESLKK